MATDDTILRAAVIVVAAFLLIPFLMLLFAVPMLGMSGGHMWDGGGMSDGAGWAWVGSWLVMLAVIGLIGYAIARALRGPKRTSTDPAIEELRMAYARGDITDEEFEERRERLESDA
ncbi:hypothetical protein L593_06585 [Salinarchaeum sp. Harcht-Bsk1]|uniref:SHOCT domain-containing protein n=1 Tax=Salinarchaeum sp. Harcht-Bsk1 TaxID=1333523 RepID=UPI0003423B98|nr:SHOCT domain-containing protein [Salinarchaeum sp. Harcht-Bsk1]AGN01264.1 hypothetical protein L593_06585 [Salinarchaeum sp. Harcht-Bsk1]